MADTTRTIDLTPTWPQAARIIAAALENGTGEGRDMARAELFRMADLLANLQADTAAREARQARTVYLVAKDTTDSEGRPMTVYWHSAEHWPQDPWAAAFASSHDHAQRDADQWCDYWASKGLPTRAHVVAFTEAELDAAQQAHRDQLDQLDRGHP